MIRSHLARRPSILSAANFNSSSARSTMNSFIGPASPVANETVSAVGPPLFGLVPIYLRGAFRSWYRPSNGPATVLLRRHGGRRLNAANDQDAGRFDHCERTRMSPTRNIYGGKDPRDIAAYTVVEAARYVRIPAQTLRSWVVGQSYSRDSRRLVFHALITAPEYAPIRLSFNNIIEAYTLRALRTRHGVSIIAARRGNGRGRTGL